MVAGHPGRAARRDGGLGRSGRGLGGGDARAAAGTSRLPTAATEDLRLIVRDRPLVLALIAMPGDLHRRADLRRRGLELDDRPASSGSRGSRIRLRCTWAPSARSRTCRPSGGHSGSCAPCRCRSGVCSPPRRAPGHVIVGGIAAVVFAMMSFSLTDVPISARVGAGLLVTAGAAGMSFIAVAMASAGADLSDETGTAVGPATIYAYLFVGGLFNLVLVEDAGAARRRPGAVHVRGVEHIGRRASNMPASAWTPRRCARGACGPRTPSTMVIVYALGGRALLKAGESAGQGGGTVRSPLVPSTGAIDPWSRSGRRLTSRVGRGRSRRPANAPRWHSRRDWAPSPAASSSRRGARAARCR